MAIPIHTGGTPEVHSAFDGWCTAKRLKVKTQMIATISELAHLCPANVRKAFRTWTDWYYSSLAGRTSFISLCLSLDEGSFQFLQPVSQDTKARPGWNHWSNMLNPAGARRRLLSSYPVPVVKKPEADATQQVRDLKRSLDEVSEGERMCRRRRLLIVGVKMLFGANQRTVSLGWKLDEIGVRIKISGPKTWSETFGQGRQMQRGRVNLERQTAPFYTARCTRQKKASKSADLVFWHIQPLLCDSGWSGRWSGFLALNERNSSAKKTCTCKIRPLWCTKQSNMYSMFWFLDAIPGSTKPMKVSKLSDPSYPRNDIAWGNLLNEAGSVLDGGNPKRVQLTSEDVKSLSWRRKPVQMISCSEVMSCIVQVCSRKTKWSFS